MAFKLKTNSGTYKVWMRERYRHIKSEKALREMIQGIINTYNKKEGWQSYGDSLQNKLDKNEFFDLASLLGIFNKSIRLADEKGRKVK